MYYSSGNYAFAHPKKPEGVDHKSAYIIGSGLAALCGFRSTSCPDQIAKNLKKALEEMN